MASPAVSTCAASGDARRKRVILLTASLVCSLIMLDSNIVAVSLPSIARSLGATFADVEWVVSSYIVCFAALLLAAGTAADRHGRKRLMLAGLAIFAVSSLACGLATSGLMLDVARAVQGVGASLLLTAALAVINHVFVGAERAKAYGFWGACLGIAIASGPIVGGVITGALGWRWAFLINVPVCAALLLTARAVIDESSDPDATRVDVRGMLTFSVGLFLFIWALIDGNARGWTSAAIVGRLVGAVALFAAFVAVERAQPRPMIDLTLFRQPTLVGSVFAMIGYAGGAQVMIFYLPLFVQNVYGFAPARAGLAMLPFAIPMFLAPRVGARLATRWSGRAILTLGLATTLAGDVAMAALAGAGVAYPGFAVAMALTGTGAGLLNGETTKVMLGAIPVQRAGMGSGLSATVRFAALLVGVAGLGAVLAGLTSRGFVASGGALGLTAERAAAAAHRVASGDLDGVLGELPIHLHAAARAAGHAAFATGFAGAALLAAAMAAVTGVLTFAFVRAVDTPPVAAGDPARAVAMIE
jgi:EmrB/QacA subfamily drug resistance transporter